ncbi:hypothetical protein AGMMS50276_20160 [Synergistales bacterium]|nr:hypothetical protein AGMMS50276_20160 [Synergistales bacterium]
MGLRVFFSSDMVRYGFLPGTVISELRDVWRNNFIELSLRDTQDAFDVLVVTPYQGKTLTSEWARYVTNMMIQGVPVVHPGTVYEFFTGRLPIEYMAEELGVIFRPPLVYPYVKRFIDLIMIALCLFPAILCTLVIALAALCSSGRPIFFVQKRIGKNGVPFLMYKFRSMTASGEVTSVGRYLRKCHMDELPQILNVLRGEMSFIGPRPETPDLAARYARDIPFYPYRYSMRPGITGWAQVNYGYASVTSENKIKLGYDLYYIKHASFVLEISIILKTVKIVLFGFK